MRAKVLPWTKENVDRYRSSDNLLKHAKTGQDIQGKILVGTQGDLIGYIAWSPDYIVALEVSPKYRGQGIATRLLEECPVKKLTVSYSNLRAIKLYKDLGYQVYRREPKILYMKKTYRVKRFSRISQKGFASYRQEIQRTLKIGKLLKKPEEVIEKDILDIKNRRHKLAKRLWDTRKSINGLGPKLEKNLVVNIPGETKKLENILLHK